MNRFRLLTIFAIAAQAVFAASPSAGAEDPCQGPAMEKDLETQMPPVDAQGASEWCGTFTAKALLDFNAHAVCQKQQGQASKSCDYGPTTRFSAEDINSVSSDGSESVRGKTFDLRREGKDIMSLLEGVQEKGAVSDQDLPFNQTLFLGTDESIPLISKLLGYYSDERERALSGNPACARPPSFSEIENTIPNLRKIADEVAKIYPDVTQGKSEFLDRISKLPGFSIPSDVQARRKVLHPSFAITQYKTRDDLDYESRVLDSLKQGQPLAASVCYWDLIKNAGINEQAPPNPKDCGPNGMVIVGISRDGAGKCKMHLRNSRGDSWPAGKGDGKADGTVWVDAGAFMKSLDRTDGLADLHSIRPSDAPEPANEIHGDGYHFLGKTAQGAQLKGVLELSEGVVFDGAFDPKTGVLLHGTVHYKSGDGKADADTQSGTFTLNDARVVLDGEHCKLSKIDGSSEEGVFHNGKFVSGSLVKTPTDGGWLYTGHLEQGSFTCGFVVKAGQKMCVHNDQMLSSPGATSLSGCCK